MSFDINNVIYVYIFICIVLLILNIGYIFISNLRKGQNYRYAYGWSKLIKKQIKLLETRSFVERVHRKRLERKLVSTQQLISYACGLDMLREKGIDTEEYLKANYVSMQILAYKYKKKEAADKAFFSFFISNNIPCDGSEYNVLMEVLVSYLEESTIYCRENVLKALYAMGNYQAIENAFRIMSERKWFHHHKLISDGLVTFKGDKEELAEKMWLSFNNLDVNIMLSIIKFISVVSDNFKERLFPLLKSKDLDIEVHIAIMRYYRNHIYEPVKVLLLGYIKSNSTVDENIKIVATSILEK